MEELRTLSPVGFRLCSLVKEPLRKHIVQRAIYWRKRGKVQNCLLGNENTSHYHMRATVWLRKNQVRPGVFSLGQGGHPLQFLLEAWMSLFSVDFLNNVDKLIFSYLSLSI